MTSIKPPSGRPPELSGASAPEVGDAAGPEGAQFAELVEDSAASAETPRAAAAGAADPLQALAAAVQAGELTPAAAVEQLVERAAGQVAHALTPAQRQDLLALLREAVSSDPALIELRHALGD